MNYFETTSLPIIKFPILTRWGTFIDCCSFVFENFNRIKEFINLLEDSEDLKNMASDIKTQQEIEQIASYAYLSKAIRYLESADLTVMDQIITVETVYEQLNDQRLIKRMANILEKNPDYSNIVKIVKDKELLCKFEIKFLLLTNAAVERGFNYLKLLLSNNRRRLKVSNISFHLSVMMNDI